MIALIHLSYYIILLSII